jgi:molybdopterin-guanine dinucleotide biosynthesis protein A
VAFAAVILAGGQATRLGGVDKVLIKVGDLTLLERSIQAVKGADPVVVVGPERDIDAEVTWVREDPPGAGPVAALKAGIAALDLRASTVPGEAHVAVLAGDLIGIDAGTVPRLRSILDENPGVAGAVLVDTEGYVQWMHGVWRLKALRDAGPGRSLKSVLGALPLIEVPERDGESRDVDTPDDLR